MKRHETGGNRYQTSALVLSIIALVLLSGWNHLPRTEYFKLNYPEILRDRMHNRCYKNDSDADACHALGQFRSNSDYSVYDEQAAFKAFSKACALGLDYSCTPKGIMQVQFDSIPRDDVESDRVLRPGCFKKSDAWACFAFGELVMTTRKRSIVDYSAARLAFAKACSLEADNAACGYQALLEHFHLANPRADFSPDAALEHYARFKEPIGVHSETWRWEKMNRACETPFLYPFKLCGWVAMEVQSTNPGAHASKIEGMKKRECEEQPESMYCDLLSGMFAQASVPPDVTSANQHFESSCEKGYGLSCYFRGRNAERAGEPAAGFYKRSCELNGLYGCFE